MLDLYGRNVLIMHGDTLCTDDAGYQAFRAKVHNPWVQRLFLTLPLFIRRRIAARMRAGSKAANSSKSLDIMDVNAQTVVAEMENTAYSGWFTVTPTARQCMNFPSTTSPHSAWC